MLQPSTIQLLRFHFSFFLLPVYLFALSQLPAINWLNALIIFVILHLLVYPSSNGYNSYMDRDETPIGGLSKPLQPTRQLFIATVLLDIVALIISLFVSIPFALGILLYILASRAYSYRGIRLKKYPLTGFLIVFFFQGALVFWLTYHGAHPNKVLSIPLLPAFASSLLIGALYPLTQIYQHKEDKQDGVTTISYKLGKRGTFLLSMFFFVTATGLLFALFKEQERLNFFYLFLLVTIPVVCFFLYWMRCVWKNEAAANFKNTMRMNVISTICTAIYFSLLIILKP